VLFLMDVEDDQEWHTAQDEKHEHEGAWHGGGTGSGAGSGSGRSLGV
jgi:hypothetical protein